jgi:hypothetical protein
MNNKWIFSLILILFSTIAYGHKNPMKWGKITKDELQMTSYSYDPEAPAVVLCDFGTVEVGGRTEYTRHTRIKVFKPKGLQCTTVEIPYKSFQRYEQVMGIKAQSFYLDQNGQIIKTKISAKNIKEEIIDSRNKKYVFTFDNVKPGMVIEYKYTIISLELAHLDNWYFQTTIPTIHSEYWISVPRRFDYLITYQKGRALDTDEQVAFADRIQWLYNLNLKKAHKDLSKTDYLLYSSQKGTAKVYLSYGETMFFKMDNVPALKPNENMVAFSDYYPTVKAHLYYVDQSFGFPFYYRRIIDASQVDYGVWNSNRLYFDNFKGYILYWLPTWDEYNQLCLKDDRIGGRLIKTFNYKDIIDSSLLNTENNLQKTETIYKYVSSNITWNGVYSMYASQSNNRIIEKKTGTSGDINLLLISLLKKAGVEVNPVLVRTRNLGRIENMYPVKEQFNHIIAQVIIDDKTLYLDASSGNTQFDKLPWTVNNAVGWVLKRKDYGWTEINNKI